MANGGKRPGAGRKKGVPNKATAARERAVAASGSTPLDVMIKAMRNFEALANECVSNKKRFEYYLRAAVAVAKDAAVYVHPRVVPTGGADAGVTEVVHRVEVTGGLPIGSNPERPEGSEYSDVPPEEAR
ncbi:hypothetical protein [Bradyrhizobium uaiense]|uniref:Uncharacterized protein n=1 Tax=Bradyrhizobium uaiense TaxID=2594946 RepID=A0A6P1BDK1_9BRAD|nr:hypothetical protein [Bradyrhizobium uaiense]NEU95661.1 hypothetical protein [Bradyrhizobium uaiense]